MSSGNNSFKGSVVSSIQKTTSAKSSFEGKGSPEINLISLTYSNKCDKINDFLKKNPYLPILTMKDIRLYSLLHIACLNNQLEIAKRFFEYLKAQDTPEDEITEWVNTRTDEGFTAVHFASFKGSIELIKLLEGYGADTQVKNHQGLNVMHIAAQGDQPISLAYFLRKGFDIQELDNKGSTPLHWAAFLGMENATIYLTSWGSDPNVKDVESGFTPLHLAVVSGNGRVVRRLLIKGANRHIKDNEDKTPKDLALENEYGHIVQLLEGRSWIVECFNIKPGFQRRRTRYSLLLFIALLLTAFLANIIFIFPFISASIWIVLFGIFVGLTTIFFLFSWLTNPGYMKNKKTDILSLLLKYEAHRVCPECVILKPDRSRHCDYCGSCVAVFDHHCPWIDNCVGARNHKYFLMFIFSTLLSVLFITILAAAHIGVTDPVYKYSLVNWKDDDALFDFKEAVCVADFILALIFGVPLVLLNSVQMNNFIKGKTTNERFGFQGTNKEPLKSKVDGASVVNGDFTSESVRPENEPNSFMMNCQAMCCNNATDSKYNYQQARIN
jgi:palmitoyltransferase